MMRVTNVMQYIIIKTPENVYRIQFPGLQHYLRIITQQWGKNLPSHIQPLPKCGSAQVCPVAQTRHLRLWPCSDSSRLLSLMTMLAKSVSSTKSEVMMLTPSTPGLWASTQDMMVGRFLEPQEEESLCVKASWTFCHLDFSWNRSPDLTSTLKVSRAKFLSL